MKGKNEMKTKNFLYWLIALCISFSILPTSVFASETQTKGYTLNIYNADGSVGYVIDGTKSISDFKLKSAIEDARVFVNNAFMFGITTPATYEVVMYESSTETESFEIGSDVTLTGANGGINVKDGVTVKLNGCTLDVGSIANSGTIEVYGETILDVASASGNSVDLMEGAIIKDSTFGGAGYVSGNVTFRGDNTFTMLTDYGDYYSLHCSVFFPGALADYHPRCHLYVRHLRQKARPGHLATGFWYC